MAKDLRSSVKSSTLRMGAKTIFFDVNLASNNKKYLKITDTRFTGEGKDRIRSSVVLFPENIEGFQKSLQEMVSYLN
jgi:phage protein U